MRGSNQREFEGKDFPHASGEYTRGLAPSWSEHASDEIPPQFHQEITKGWSSLTGLFYFPDEGDRSKGV